MTETDSPTWRQANHGLLMRALGLGRVDLRQWQVLFVLTRQIAAHTKKWWRALSISKRLLIGFVGLYAFVFPRAFPLINFYTAGHATFARITDHNLFVALGLMLAALALVILNQWMWRVARDRANTFTRRVIILGWFGASLALLFTHPGQSSDMYDYTFRAHMVAHLGKNPLTTPPSAIIPDNEFPQLAWRYTVDSYGPLWHGLAASMHALVGEDLLANLLGFKLIAILATGISGRLIYLIVRQSARRYANASLAIWLWNPLVLNEGALHGHNDFVMTAIILFAIWLLIKQHSKLGIVVMILAGLIKINAWIFLPIVLLWLWRERGLIDAMREIAPGIFAGVGLIWLAYLPFDGWARIIEIVQNRSWWPAGTWTAALFFALRDGQSVPHEIVIFWIIGGATGLFIAATIILLFKIRDLCVGAWSVFLAYLLVGCHWLMIWYAVPLVAFAAIIPNRSIVAFTLFFCFFLLINPIVGQYVVSQIALPPGGSDLITSATTLLLPQIAALCFAIGSLQRARRKTQVGGVL